MRWWGLLALLGAAACAGAPAASPYEHVVLEGNLSRRYQLHEAATPDAPVMRIERDGDVYRVTDLLLDKTIDWVVPYDDPKPRLLRFQHTSVTCQAGLLRSGASSVDLKNGGACVLHKDGTLTQAP